MEKKTIYALFSSIDSIRCLLAVGEKSKIIEFISGVPGYAFIGDPEEIILDNPEELNSTFPLAIGNDLYSCVGADLEIEKATLLL